MSETSLFHAVVRTYVRSVIGVSLAIVIVGSLVAGNVVLRRDDAAATALARTMGSELKNHARDTPAELDVQVVHELDEQRWFSRTIEVWRAGRRIGGAANESVLSAWAEHDDICEVSRVENVWQRICTVRVDPQTVVIVASELLPIFASLLPLLLAVSLVALATVVVFSMLSRRVVRRSLEPLQRFEEGIASLPALATERRVGTSWGASEVDGLANTFNTLLARIDTAVQRERRFVADAAHELRTPLTRLRAQLELVLQLSVDEEPRQRLERAAATSEQLSRIIEALLALAREAVRVEDAVELNEVAQLCIQRLDETERSRIEVVAGESALVRGDESLLVLALSNLLDNALKYTTGPVVLRISDDCTVAVEDRGAGIAADELPAIREPFVRGRVRPTSARGTGLGLALVDHVARLHGGSLALTPREPHGLSASIHLPTWRPQTTPPSAGG